MLKKLFALLCSSCLIQASLAQTLTIPIETKNSALVLQVEENQDLNILYLGEKLSDTASYRMIPGVYRESDDYTGMLNAAYTSSGSRNLLEPAIAVTHADGNNSLDLKYQSHQLDTSQKGVTFLTVQLKDPVYDFQVTLYYKAYTEFDVVEQWSQISHSEKGSVTLHKFASANLFLQADDYWLRQYHGDWAKEMQPEETRLTHGIKVLDTKLGTRANLFQPSVFMISLDEVATEDEGEVLLGGLEWSGNFRIDLEVDPLNNLRIMAGINNYASDYSLNAKDTFNTPAFLFTFSSHGKGKASRNLHQWARKYKLLDGEGSRLTLLNNWEATYFDFNEKKLKELLKDTKKLGVDLFLLDDGWFGNKFPRNGDNAGLGDWQPNRKKLPNGISTLVSEAQNNNVKFGIWIEPEMVNPKSALYEKHPEWVIKQPKRDEYYFRNQLVLDLSNPKVQDFVFGVVDSLFTENPNLAYIKWDCNAVIYNAYSAHLNKQSHLYIDYVRGLYQVLKRVREKYPKVPMMLCSGGGGRVDYGALQYFTEFWPSDNTDPIERIFMQWEYSYFYPAIATANHVTDWGKQPIKFRTDVAMMGKLGFDIVVDHLSPEELSYCQQSIRNYDSLKNTIWHGDQYRLANPTEADVASMLYVNEEKNAGVMFNYLVNYRYGAGSHHPILLKGLDPDKKYMIKEINLFPGTQSTLETDEAYSGDFLMKIGYNPDVRKERTSVVLQIEAQP